MQNPVNPKDLVRLAKIEKHRISDAIGFSIEKVSQNAVAVTTLIGLTADMIFDNLVQLDRAPITNRTKSSALAIGPKLVVSMMFSIMPLFAENVMAKSDAQGRR